MTGCSAEGCKNRAERKIPGISFHRFPKELVLRAAWIVACRRKNWLPSPKSVLCSQHFTEDLIDRTSLAVVRLRENAIPNVFKSPSEISDCQKSSIHTPLVANRHSISNSQSQHACTQNSPAHTQSSGGSPGVHSPNSNPFNINIVINYVQKVKNRFQGRPDIYWQFLDIISTYQKQRRNLYDGLHTGTIPLTEAEVYAQIAKLFQDQGEDDLSQEFGQFVSDPNGADNELLDMISQNCKSPLKHLSSTPILLHPSFFEDEETLSCDESASESRIECGVTDTAVSLNFSENESSNEYVLPVPIPEKCKSPEKRLAFKVARAFINEVVQSSIEGTSETPTKSDVIKPIVVCLNAPSNESSVENRPPVQIQKECNFREKCLASTATIASSSNEVIESSDESISDTTTEHGVMEPIVCLNSTVNGSNVEIPVQESDSEDYPSDDVDMINLKRKLAAANNLVSTYRKKIKALQAQNRRYKQKLEKAKRSISVLEKINKSVFL